jgi:hypothetical protein
MAANLCTKKPYTMQCAGGKHHDPRSSSYRKALNRLRTEPEGEVEEKIHKLPARNIIQAIQLLYLCT